MKMSRRQRHAVKALVYRTISILATFTVLMAFGLPLASSIGITAVIEGVSTVLYFIFEEAWDTLKEKLKLHLHAKEGKPRRGGS